MVCRCEKVDSLGTVFASQELASAHKDLRFCDLCKELGSGGTCTHNALGAGSAS
jgi:hypothetical protein